MATTAKNPTTRRARRTRSQDPVEVLRHSVEAKREQLEEQLGARDRHEAAARAEEQAIADGGGSVETLMREEIQVRVAAADIERLRVELDQLERDLAGVERIVQAEAQSARVVEVATEYRALFEEWLEQRAELDQLLSEHLPAIRRTLKRMEGLRYEFDGATDDARAAARHRIADEDFLLIASDRYDATGDRKFTRVSHKAPIAPPVLPPLDWGDVVDALTGERALSFRKNWPVLGFRGLDIE